MFAQAFAALQAMTGPAKDADPVAIGTGIGSDILALPLPGAALGAGGSAAAPAFDIMAVPGLDIVSDAVDYWVDSTQRCILFWDCLRRAGNGFLGMADDPVGVSSDDLAGPTADLEIDLPDLHGLKVKALRPDEDVMLDPDKRPIVVFDPRAGTDAGAGVLNDTIRRSLYAGHFVYQVSLEAGERAAEPAPADLEAAETVVLDRIARMHSASARPPCRIGRCADIARLAALSLLEADGMGAQLIDAVPSSYWCGLDQASPYRDVGGLLGGQWLASLDRDLGDGRQDGATAAAAPYATDAASRLWAEPYALYAAVDTDEESYLQRAHRRDGLFRRRADRARHWVGGQGLAGSDAPPGAIVLDDGSTVDLRGDDRPLLLFATDFGRRAAAPSLAGQLRRAFGSVQAIRASGRVVVYAHNAATGQLSALIMPRAAQGEPGSLDGIRPGLYELATRPVPHPDAAGTPVGEDVEVTLSARSFRSDAMFQDAVTTPEPAIARAAGLSRAIDWAYKVFLRPWVRLWTTPSLTEARRALHPVRAARAACSDGNPAMTPIKALAAWVREDRRPAAQDNDFLAAERAFAERIQTALAAFLAARNEAFRTLYRLAFNNPVWLLAGR